MDKLSHAAKTAKDFAVIFIKDIKNHKVLNVIVILIFLYFIGIPAFLRFILFDTLYRPNEKQTEFFENYYGFSLEGKEYISEVAVHGGQDSGVWLYVENINDYIDFMERIEGEFYLYHSSDTEIKYNTDMINIFDGWTFTKKKNGKWQGYFSTTKKDNEEFRAFYSENFFWGKIHK